jgi:restriction system protein
MLVDPTPQETRELLAALYESFPSGEEFEAFLKVVLSKMGLQDVTVTRYSRDGGIDLTAMRAGLEELSRVDEVKYVVQAKRYSPDRTVPIESVRALRGVMQPNDKGLFISTGKFSSDSESFAQQDPVRPVVLIDGTRLVKLCIDHEVGFKFRPIFDRGMLDLQLRPLAKQKAERASQASSDGNSSRSFVKTITANDIRARIISVPWEMDSLIAEDATVLCVEFPPHFPPRDYNYQRDRRCISGVTNVLRKFGLLGATDERVPKLSEWTVDKRGAKITVRIAENGVG